MKRTIASHIKATATLGLTCTTALVFAVATVQARPAHTAGSQAATAQALSLSPCTIVVNGARWQNREVGRVMTAGSKYTVAAGGMSCSSAGALVVALTHRHGTAYGQAFKGPRGFSCTSLTLPVLGALQVAGRCMQQPHNYPIFSWGPQLAGH